MLCPVCKVDLVMTDRQGIEIDYCPKCRGVWLDRGELDKIIERAEPAAASHHEERRVEPRPHEEYRHEDKRDYGSHHKKKKGGLLGDLFEFGD